MNLKNNEIVINFVMSSNLKSKIFESINNYFRIYLDEKFKLIVSENAEKNADIYHYHRISLESKVYPNSVATVHHDLMDTDPSFDLNMYIDNYRKCKKIVCLNSIQKRTLKDNNITNTEVIEHGYNTEIFSLKKEIKFTKGNKICLGIISKRYARRVKGEAYLLELIKRIDPKIFCFMLVGENRREDYKVLTKFGFEVDIFEELPYRLYNQLYHQIDFLLVLSLFEGGPANIPEALATGTPVIGNPIGMIVDIVKDRENGIYLTGNIDDDTTTFHNISINKDKIFSSLQQKSQKKCNLSSWQDIVKKYESVYLDILK